MAEQERPQRRIDQHGIWLPTIDSPRLDEKLLIDGRTDSHSAHAITLPRLCHRSWTALGMRSSSHMARA
jgi:hypothetical protein